MSFDLLIIEESELGCVCIYCEEIDLIILAIVGDELTPQGDLFQSSG